VYKREMKINDPCRAAELARLQHSVDLNGVAQENLWRFRKWVQWIKVFACIFSRQAMVNHRTIKGFCITCSCLMIFGIIVAFLMGSMSMESASSAASSQMSSQITSGQLVFGLLVQAASSRLFLSDELLRARELDAGASVAPYFLGKMLGNYCDFLFFPFAFLTGYYPFLHARSTFIEFWGVFMLLHLTLSSIVNFIVIVYPASNKSTITVGAVVLLWSFGGIAPPISVMETSMGAFATIVNAVSPFNYTYEVEVLNELGAYAQVWRTETLLEKFGYSFNHKSYNIGMLVLYFCVANFLAYVCVEVFSRLPRLIKYCKNVTCPASWAPCAYTSFDRPPQQDATVEVCERDVDAEVSDGDSVGIDIDIIDGANEDLLLGTSEAEAGLYNLHAETTELCYNSGDNVVALDGYVTDIEMC
jgi:hypothetical protein